MARLASLISKVLPALLATSVAAGLLAPTAASAKPYLVGQYVGPTKLMPLSYKPKPFYKPHYGYGGGWGYGAAALAGGLAIGAIAASASDGACFIERRRMVDDEGNIYVRRVRVCE